MLPVSWIRLSRSAAGIVFEPQHDQMVRTGAVSADITLRTSIGMTDEVFAHALAAAKAEAETPCTSGMAAAARCLPGTEQYTLDGFTAQPTYIAPETAPHAPRTGRQILPKELPLLGWYSHGTAHYAARWKCRPTRYSRILTPPSSCPHRLPPI